MSFLSFAILGRPSKLLILQFSKKTQKLGLGDVEIDSFKSYICNRKQFVNNDGKWISPLMDILRGVPQGSINVH
jgi:hypothetical protein